MEENLQTRPSNVAPGAPRSMTNRERIVAAIACQVPDRLPLVPRLQFWYRGRKRNGTLPQELQSLSLMEIADKLGVDYYAVAPDFTQASGEDALDGPWGSTACPCCPTR